MKNLLSVDVEDWFHYIDSRYSFPVGQWKTLSSHVRRMTEELMRLLHPRKATFFCLGWVAEHHPDVIRGLSGQGHEIGSHGMRHELVYRLGPKRFRADLARSRALLEDLTGRKVDVYRAPGFSIRPQDVWAFEEICAAGYARDSSVFPGVRPKGGIPSAPPSPFLMSLRKGTLLEIPVSTTGILGKRTAFCGGGFFRLFPYWYIRKKIRELNMAGKPAVVYIHPRDLDTRQPRMKLEPVNSFFYHYGLRQARAKFQRLLDDFEWGPFADFVLTPSVDLERAPARPAESHGFP